MGGDDPKANLKETIFNFLIIQTHALPVLELKQQLEKDWTISKEDYDFGWKKFLLTMKFVRIETRIQLNGKPLDFVYIDRDQAVQECFQNVPQQVYYDLPKFCLQPPLTLNELVAAYPSHVFRGRLDSLGIRRFELPTAKRNDEIEFEPEVERETNCWSRFLSKMRLA